MVATALNAAVARSNKQIAGYRRLSDTPKSGAFKKRESRFHLERHLCWFAVNT
jgi:hypothetical protein